MSKKRIDEIKELLQQNKKVYVNELSQKYGLSEVSIRKDLTQLEKDGFARKFYGGASLVETVGPFERTSEEFYNDPTRISLVMKALQEINDGDCIFIGSGRTCCILARHLKGFNNLTVITNNITALTDLINNVTRVYLIGGEVTSTDNQTLLSSWEQPQALSENLFVNKAFTSISGMDLKAGLTVNSIISTHIFRHIPTMAHHWYLMADFCKYDRISIYPVADLNQIQTVITDQIPDKYLNYFNENNIQVIFASE